MLELSLAKPIRSVVADALTGRRRGRPLSGWLHRIWEAAVRQAERPDRFVPNY